MIEIEHLSFRYGKQTPLILKDISFTLKQGEILAIIGKNGIGKTTLLKCISGELKGYDGGIKIHNSDIKNFNPMELSKMIAIVASNSPCYQNLCVADYLVTGFANNLVLLQTPNKMEYEKAFSVLKMMGQEKLFNSCILELSSGEFQIIKIARAILQNPKVIIFDEPTSNLDVQNQLLVIEQISELAKMGYSVITTTHNPGQIFELNGLVLMLKKDGYILGKAADVMIDENLSEIYGLAAQIEKNMYRSYAVFFNSQKTHTLFF